MPLVIVSVACGAPLAERQRQLGSLQRLNRRLLVDTEHYCMRRWVQIEADHVVDLRDELRISTDLVGSDQMWLQSVGSEHIRDTPAREAELLSKQAGGPATAPSRWRRHRKLNDL